MCASACLSVIAAAPRATWGRGAAARRAPRTPRADGLRASVAAVARESGLRSGVGAGDGDRDSRPGDGRVTAAHDSRLPQPTPTGLRHYGFTAERSVRRNSSSFLIVILIFTVLYSTDAAVQRTLNTSDMSSCAVCTAIVGLHEFAAALWRRLLRTLLHPGPPPQRA
jgi:hypothetical protein